MTTRELLLASLVCVAACGDNTSKDRPDARPGVDAAVADSAIDAEIDAPNACVADTTACIGDFVVVCGGDGMPTSTTGCALGCDETATPRCNVLEPSNLAATTCDSAAPTNLEITSGTTAMSTTAGCDAVVNQASGPSICVRRFATISIAQDATLRVTGNRALALVATQVFTVNGTIDASANGPDGNTGAEAGPGAPLSSSAGGTAANTSDGGGGAGGGTSGAAGSTNLTQGAGGTAGAATTTGPTLAPILPGATGGSNGATTAFERAVGGLGGGGLQLVSCGAMTIGAAGVIDASGSGGAGGPGSTTLGSPGGGGGGGSGGEVLIEAASLTVAGIVAANGGAGGGGGLTGTLTVAGADGARGADGEAGTTAAVGGAGPAESGDGGAGGALSGPAVGQAPVVSTGTAGGGGGASGLIRVNVRTGATANITGAISPAHSAGAIVVHPQP